MSYYLQFDDGESLQVASNSGWGDVIDWVESLDYGCDELQHLVEYGWCQNVPELGDELQDAIEATPPGDASTQNTVDNLLNMILVSDGAAVATVDCGLEADETNA